MAADGSLIIDTKIREDGFIAGTKELEAAARRMANSLSGLGDKAKIALQKQTDSFVKLNSQYSQQAQKVGELKRKVAEYQRQKMPTQEYLEIQKQIDTAQSKLDGLIAKQQKFLDMGGSRNSKTYKSAQYDIEELTNTIKYAKGELKELKAAGNAFTFGGNTEGAKQDIQRLAQEEAKLHQMNERLDTSWQSLKLKVSEYQKQLVKASDTNKKASDSGEKLNRSLRGTKKAAGGARMGIGKMLVTSVLFSAVFRALSAIMNGVKEGMGNLAQYSGTTNAMLSKLMSSMTQLKNAFATAFAPILTVIAPALNYLIRLLTAAATAVAQLISALTGKNTFVKAVKVQEDYAASLKKTGGAAKQARKDAKGSLAPFDKLNQMQEEAGGDSGGGADGGVSPNEMFETVEVNPAIAKAIDMLKAKYHELAALLKKGFQIGVGDLSVLDSIKAGLNSIGDSMERIFTDADVSSAFQNMLNTLAYDTGRVAGAFASIGLSLADNLIGGIARYLGKNEGVIKEYLISIFDITSEVSTIFANFTVALADIFTVFRSDDAKQITADLIAIFSNAFMGASELGYKFGRDIIDSILTPFTENADKIKAAAESTIGPIADVTGALADSVTETFSELNRMYDEHVAPLFAAVRDGLSEILETVLDGYNKYVAPVLSELAKRFRDVWGGTIQPVINNAIGLIGDIADLIKVVWEKILQPVINWIAGQIMPAVAPVLKALGDDFMNTFEFIGKIIDVFLSAARALVQFLTGAFQTDWGNALAQIKEKFSEVWESFPGIIKGTANRVLAGIEEMINGAISGLNGFIEKANGLIGRIPGFSDSLIPTVGTVSLPRLASGTVVPPRAGEFAAILGDNKRETEVVSPLSTMKQALKEALQEAGEFGGGDITAYIYLDGKELGNSTVEFVRQEKKRTGRNPVLV